ncbi:unnamed protein product [Phaeothamnion confervicola]
MNLKEVVMDALEAKGVLGQIRASLRAAVFTCIDEYGAGLLGEDVPKPRDTEEGALAVQLVRDFLSHFGLGQTLSVFMAEVNMVSL